MTNQCPLNDGYRFIGECRVKTCKYFTEKTAHRCMGIDTKFAATERGVTQAEIALLKLPAATKKEVAKKIRTAQDTVKAALYLNEKFSELKRPKTLLDLFQHNLDLFCFKQTDTALYQMLTTDFSVAIGLDGSNLHKLLELDHPNLHLPFKLTEKELVRILDYIGENYEQSSDA